MFEVGAAPIMGAMATPPKGAVNFATVSAVAMSFVRR